MPNKKLAILVTVVMATSLILAACQTETIRETVVVTEKETVVETVVETVIQTVVETRVVEEQVIVTATPEPAGEISDRRGGVLKHALPAINTLDPAFLTSIADDQVARYWHDMFLNLDKDLKPDWDRSIATGYEVNEEGTVWTFDVRRGVTFHDGRPLTADDVVFSFDRLRDPDVGAATVGLYENIQSIEALDDYTVRFTLERPNPDFILYDLNDYHAHIMDKNAEDFETDWNGTGPFIIESYIPEDRLVMKRNPDYWMIGIDGEPLPYLDGLEFIFLTEASAQFEALRGGQVHWLNYVSPEFVDVLRETPGFTVNFKESNFHWVIHMRADQPPTDDVRVRQAIKAATDRQELLEVAGLGLGVAGNDSPIGPALSDFYLDVPPPEQDIEAAKALLAEAGYPDGLEIELTAQDALTVRSIATVWAEQLAEAGITVNIQVVPVGTYYGDNLWLESQFGITDWGSRASPQPYLSLAYVCDAQWNESHYCDPEFDELALQAGSELDHETRVELYHQIQEIFRERGAVVVPFFTTNVLAYSNSVKPGLESYAIATDVELRWVWLDE